MSFKEFKRVILKYRLVAGIREEASFRKDDNGNYIAVVGNVVLHANPSKRQILDSDNSDHWLSALG